MMKASERSKNVRYAIRDIAVIAKQVEKEKRVLYLNIGDPNRFDFDTPAYLKKAVISAINSGKNYYADSVGVPEAVEALVKHNNRLGITTDADSVMFTTGVSEAINVFVASAINPGEGMMIPSPSYPLYSAYLDLFGCEKKFHVLAEDDGWNLDLSDIERKITPKTRAITIINPNNPTGGVYDKKTLRGLVDIAGQYDLVILSDEIYDGMILDGEMCHVAAMSKDVPVVTCNGLAKNFLAPGWRTGWVSITDRDQKISGVRDAMMQLGRARLCSTAPMQFAVKPALEKKSAHSRQALKKLRSRRDLTFRRINEIDGLSLVKPKAAFYAFPRIDFGIDDKEFVTGLLKEEGVATVHGSGFDMPGHFRIVYLPSEKILDEAFDKIEKYVRKSRK